MNGATILISGDEAEGAAGELHARLLSKVGSPVVDHEVEVLRTADLLVLIGLVFSGVSASAAAVGAADVIAGWWNGSRGSSQLNVRIERSDGTSIELEGEVTPPQLAAALGADQTDG